MEQDLLSKKELLELTGISYGQLYRWKRKHLIPEDWFIHRSTFTGQETFFPKDKILARIEQIKNMKDGMSLDELASMLALGPVDISMSREELIKRNIVSDVAVELYRQMHPDTETYSFLPLLCLYTTSAALSTGDVSLEEARLLVNTLEQHLPSLEGQSVDVVLLRKLGLALCLLVDGGAELRLEPGAKLVLRLHMPAQIEQLRLKLL
ncbi:hypothetical protein GCM10025857_28180 [Alicyclobacillus contaminans]|uniref:YhbD family protein n=1 Tax=Alicyclobacillus contaminans TaxID=392016 RepID=UPI0003FD6C0C|nr:YhbD family protein [Alicyclobacillus contaminans]GMA51461.1 hypothetical protein GCM10025857_28180 [Alicyclobacillus contaminans]